MTELHPPETPAQGAAGTAVPSSAEPRRRRSSWRRARRGLGRVLARAVGPRVVHWLSRSWRYEELHPERRASARGEGGGLLIALWHGRMLQAVPPHASDEIVVLVSGSRDGDIAALLLRDFRYEIIRGSTTRGGARALRQMIEALHRGALVVVTPDGPQGPRHSMNPGLAWMARATGFAVLPVGIVCDRAWHMNSWDRFDVPKPGARVVVSYGNPVQVPRELPSDGLAEATERIREELVNAERAGFAKLGREPDF